METYQCTIADLSYYQNERVISVEVEDNYDSYMMRTTVDGIELSVSGNGLFTTFQKLRDELLKIGFGMKCNAARINAVQSGMMADLDVVYLVELGERASTTLVNSFWDYANIDKFPNTEEQREFADKWFESISRS